MSKYAKTIAAIATPVVLVALAKMAAAIGVDVTFDEGQVNEVIVAIITTIAVYAVPNQTA